MAEEQEISEGVKKLMGIANDAMAVGDKYGFKKKDGSGLGLDITDSIYRAVVSTDSNGEAQINPVDAKAKGTEIYTKLQKHLFMKVLGWSETDFNTYMSIKGNNTDINGSKLDGTIEDANGVVDTGTLSQLVDGIAKNFDLEDLKKTADEIVGSYAGVQHQNIVTRAKPQTVDDTIAMNQFLGMFGVDAKGAADPGQLLKLYASKGLPAYQKAMVQAAQQKANGN